MQAIFTRTSLHKIGSSGLVLAVALISLSFNVSAIQAAEPSGVSPYVVKIHADWCMTCRKLEPIWRRIESEFGDRIQLVVLDVSDRAAVGRSQAEADRLGLSDFFREYRAATGTIAVIDGRTLEPAAVMRGEDDISVYAEAIEEARP